MLLCCLLLHACEALVDDKKSYVTREIELTPVGALHVYDNISVYLVPDTIGVIKINAPEGYSVKIDSLPGGIRLYAHITKRWQYYTDSVVVYVGFGNNITSVNNYSTGNIASTGTITSQNLLLYSQAGSGQFNVRVRNHSLRIISHSFTTSDFFIKGETQTLQLVNKGMGMYHLTNLGYQAASIQQRGTGNIYMHVNDSTDIAIRASGNVYYSGSLSVIQLERTGTGELINNGS